MPVISKFYGIIIRMYFRQSEHNPPHIHAICGENVIVINILNNEILEGDLPVKEKNYVLEWTKIHQVELINIWETQEFKKIEPFV